MKHSSGNPFTLFLIIMVIAISSCSLASLVATQAPNIQPSFEPPVVNTFTPVAPPPVAPSLTETDTPIAPPLVSPSFTPGPVSNEPLATFIENANCHSGPGTKYEVVTSFLQGQVVEIVARNSDPNNTWWYVKIPGTNSECWVSLVTVNATGNFDGIPIMTPIAPPAIPPSPTPIAPPAVPPSPNP